MISKFVFWFFLAFLTCVVIFMAIAGFFSAIDLLALKIGMFPAIGIALATVAGIVYGLKAVLHEWP
jgi:hypothetical protein